LSLTLGIDYQKRSREEHELKITAKTVIYATNKLGFSVEPKIQNYKNRSYSIV
jgi:hypothetical protein